MNSHSLSSVVASDIELEQALQRSPLEANLFVLTAGQAPPNPTQLLSSQGMQQLMQQFEEAYSLVIYDTPPLLYMWVLNILNSDNLHTKLKYCVFLVNLSSTRQ